VSEKAIPVEELMKDPDEDAETAPAATAGETAASPAENASA
jgi:hypothetical protein